MLADHLSSLLKSEKFTDLTVKLDDRTWKVHKTVVCARSDFFAKTCEGEFKVSATICKQKGSTRVL